MASFIVSGANCLTQSLRNIVNVVRGFFCKNRTDICVYMSDLEAAERALIEEGEPEFGLTSSLQWETPYSSTEGDGPENKPLLPKKGAREDDFMEEIPLNEISFDSN